jgi:hypothetical protein
MVLIIGSAWSYTSAVLAIARFWSLATVLLVVLYAVQIALLVSPPVYGRTRRTPIFMRSKGWMRLARWPPAWLLPWGLFLGVVLTLAYLGNMGFVAVPGCRPATAEVCRVFAEGYPLRWLTRFGEISKYALIKDCAQWALACSSVLYLAWNWLRPGPAPEIDS